VTVTAVVELACNWCGRCLASTAPPGALAARIPLDAAQVRP